MLPGIRKKCYLNGSWLMMARRRIHKRKQGCIRSRRAAAESAAASSSSRLQGVNVNQSLRKQWRFGKLDSHQALPLAADASSHGALKLLTACLLMADKLPRKYIIQDTAEDDFLKNLHMAVNSAISRSNVQANWSACHDETFAMMQPCLLAQSMAFSSQRVIAWRNTLTKRHSRKRRPEQTQRR